MDRCPYLEYRRESGDREFETERAYCTAAGRFVQPMRADICNCRYGLRPDEDCEIYRRHEAADASGRSSGERSEPRDGEGLDPDEGA